MLAPPRSSYLGELAVRVDRFSIAFRTSRSIKASSTDAVLDFVDCLRILASNPCVVPLPPSAGLSLATPPSSDQSGAAAAVYLSAYRPATPHQTQKSLPVFAVNPSACSGRLSVFFTCFTVKLCVFFL